MVNVCRYWTGVHITCMGHHAPYYIFFIFLRKLSWTYRAEKTAFDLVFKLILARRIKLPSNIREPHFTPPILQTFPKK
jgi:hypothetical protein